MQQLQRKLLVNDATVDFGQPFGVHRVICNETCGDDLRLSIEELCIQVVECLRQSAHLFQTFTVLNEHGISPVRIYVNPEAVPDDWKISIESKPVDLVEEFECVNRAFLRFELSYSF